MRRLSDPDRLNVSLVEDEPLQSELSALLDQKLSPSELQALMEVTLGRYISNKRIVKIAVEHGLLLSEWHFIESHKESKLVLGAIEQTLALQNQAKQVAPSATFSCVARYSPILSQAIDNFAQTCHTRPNENDIRLKVYAKESFREIVDAVEGSIQPYLQMYYELETLRESGSERRLPHSLGALLDELRRKCFLPELLCPRPWNLPISQWRNIGGHNSYVVKGEVVQCTYGRSSTANVLTLTRGDIITLRQSIATCYQVLRIAHTLFFFDNIELLQGIISGVELNEDTLIIQLQEIFFASGLRVASMSQTDKLELVAQDLHATPLTLEARLRLAAHRASSFIRTPFRIRTAPRGQPATVVEVTP